jgi:hypothetical protein
MGEAPSAADLQDLFARERAGLLSQLLPQVPLADPAVLRAAEQCACYLLDGWTAHRVHVDDDTAERAWRKAEGFLDAHVPVVSCVYDSEGLRALEGPLLRIGRGVHSPVRFHIENRTGSALSGVSDGCAEVDTWQAPVDPWNVRGARNRPSVSIPAGASGWLVTTPCPAEDMETLPENLTFQFEFDGLRRTLTVPAMETPTVRLTLRTSDSSRGGASTPAELRIATSIGTVQVPAERRNYLHVLPAGIHPFFRCADTFPSHGETTLLVPAGAVRIEAQKGFEYRKAVWEGEIFTDTTLTIVLERLGDPAKDGWYSGDSHVHWARTWVYLGDDTAELALQQRAADCHAIAVLTLSQWDGFQEVFTPVHHPVGPILEHSDADYVMGMDEEYRNSGPYGHVNVYGLKRLIVPVSTGFTKDDKAPDFPDNRFAFEEAHRQGAIAACSHGIWAFDKVLAALGLMDAVDQVSITQYYPLLDCGFRIPTTVGTDANARPMGRMRTYVRVEGAFTYAAWIEGIRRGRTFVTGGPLLALDVGDGASPGDVVRLDAPGRLRIRGSSRCETPQRVLEVVWNGAVVASVGNADAREELTLDVELPFEESGWLALRSTSGTVCDWMDNDPAAHTSPVYIEVGGKPMKPRRTAVEGILAEIRAYRESLPGRAKFDSEAQRESVLATVDEALVVLQGLRNRA